MLPAHNDETPTNVKHNTIMMAMIREDLIISLLGFILLNAESLPLPVQRRLSHGNHLLVGSTRHSASVNLNTTVRTG